MNNRPIVTFPRGPDGLLVEPDHLTPDVARIIDHNRQRFCHHFNYADQFGAGNPDTYDPRGDYNCGRCNQVQGTGCLLVDIPEIDLGAGSCEDWESIRDDDAEADLRCKSPAVANYGVAKNGQGFGCKRCPWAKPAKNRDYAGRLLWCGEGGFHVTPTACCTANGVETEESFGDDVKYERMMRERPGEYWGNPENQEGYRRALRRRSD